jgi:hypothetical protein
MCVVTLNGCTPILEMVQPDFKLCLHCGHSYILIYTSECKKIGSNKKGDIGMSHLKSYVIAALLLLLFY